MRKETEPRPVHLVRLGHESGFLPEQLGLAPVREQPGGGGGAACLAHRRLQHPASAGGSANV